MKTTRFFLVLVVMAVFPLKAQQEELQQHFKEILDLPYLSPEEVSVDSLQRLNLLLPSKAVNPPLLFWIGGGAWSFVDRNIEMDLCRKFASEGIAVASVGHRLSKGTFSEKRKTTGVQHPEHIKDVAAAFKWIVDKAEEYGYDKSNIFVGGFSSGAHLAALLGMDKKYLGAHGLQPKAIRGLVPVSGAYDIQDYYNVFYNHENEDTRPLAKTHVKDVFGDESAFDAASPVTYIKDLTLPLLLISDNALTNYTQLFEAELKAVNYPKFEVYYEKNLNHGELWQEMSKAENSKTRELVLQFIKDMSNVE